MVRPTPDLLAPRIAPASRLTSFGGYRPAVCGRPTGMILTRAHRSSDLLRKRASPGGYFTRAIYAGGQNHAGPATCSRAPVGSPASALRYDHRLARRLPCGRKRMLTLLVPSKATASAAGLSSGWHRRALDRTPACAPRPRLDLPRENRDRKGLSSERSCTRACFS